MGDMYTVIYKSLEALLVEWNVLEELVELEEYSFDGQRDRDLR